MGSRSSRGSADGDGSDRHEEILLTAQLAAAEAAAREAEIWAAAPPSLDPADWRGPAAAAQDVVRDRAAVALRRAAAACDELVFAARRALASLDG